MNDLTVKTDNPATGLQLPYDLQPEELKAALARRSSNRETLMDWLKTGLVEGIDYGRIHTVGKTKCQFANQGRSQDCPNPAHWSRECLFKPGAERICGMLGLRVEFPALADYERMIVEGKVIAQILLRCLLIGADGQVIAVGVGARSLQKDDGDLNKSLKMAEKSAMIDATLRLAGFSAIFTQDAEDKADEDDRPTRPQATPQGAPVQPVRGASHPNNPPGSTAPEAPGQAAAEKPSEQDVQEVYALSLEAGIDPKRLSSWINAATRGRAATLQELTAHELGILRRKLIKQMGEAPPKAGERVIEGVIIPNGYHVEP